MNKKKEINKKLLHDIGEICKKARKEHGKTQLQIAMELEYSIENISGFERGNNNNAVLLLYYILNFNVFKEVFKVFVRWNNANK